jgi:hypothetical protein
VNLWISIGFNADADLDPALYLNADPDPDPDPWSQTNLDPCGYLHEGIGKKTYLRRVQKPFWKAGNHEYLIILANFDAPESGSAFPIRIRAQDSQMNADPDPQHCVIYWETFTDQL